MNFSRFARPYHWMTNHRLWKANIREVAKQLPPSAAHLNLLDIGCGSGITLQQFVEVRPDIVPIGLDPAYGMLVLAKRHTPYDYLLASGTRIPLADNSIDAVFAQRVYYFLPSEVQKRLLAEVLRVLRPGGRFIMVNPAADKSPLGAWRELQHGLCPALDMFVWHLVANQLGGFTPQSISERLIEAGFARILAEPVLNGWAILSRGEKPYAEGTSTLERVKSGDSILSTAGKFIHLLIKQSPNKPAWALKPEDKILWEAAAVAIENQPTALAFTSLPKAVSFMQQAVMTGTIKEISKVAKFSKQTAAAWPFPILLNPEENLPATSFIPIDPSTAESPDE